MLLGEEVRRSATGKQTAKLYTIVDGLRYHRSDTSLVRVIVPIGKSEELAQTQAVHFIQSAFTPLRDFFPL